MVRRSLSEGSLSLGNNFRLVRGGTREGQKEHVSRVPDFSGRNCLNAENDSSDSSSFRVLFQTYKNSLNTENGSSDS